MHRRRNFRLGVLNGLAFGLAETLTDPTLVLVAFVSHLTHSPLWLGLIAPLRDGAWFLPQLWVSGYLQSQPRKLPLYRWMAVLRMVTWAAMAAAVFLVRDVRWLLGVFFLTFGIYSLAAGFSGLSFLEVVGKTVPPHRRPTFFAWRMTLGALTGLGASAVVRWLLGETSPFTFPHNFGVLFALGWPIAAWGLWMFARITEPVDARVQAAAPVATQLKRALGFLRADAHYRDFIVLRAALMVSGAAVPFFAVYVQQQLGGSQGMVGVYLAVFTVSNLVANTLLGRWAIRLGNRRILQLGAWAALSMTGLVLALALTARPLQLTGTLASFWLVPVFALSGLRESGIGVSAQSLLLDIAPVAERSLYLGFTNSFLGVVLLATGASGLIVAQFGFPALLGVALLANVTALVSAQRLSRWPGG